MDEWASMGPSSPDYEKWGKILTSTFKDKMFKNSDDQSALVYLILTGKGGWKDKIYLENEYYFEGYWFEIVGRLENISARYSEMEMNGPAVLRRRHAESVFMSNAKQRDGQLAREKGAIKRRPFLTHFTGCQPCSGDRNKQYSGDNCTEGMYKALNFADDQVLRIYGFRHSSLLSGNVQPLPFDYPHVGR
ncbi:putative glycosyltransferase 7 [Carex rostrata]